MSLPDVVAQTTPPPSSGGEIREYGAQGILWCAGGGLNGQGAPEPEREESWHFPPVGPGLLVHSCEQRVGICFPTRARVRCSSTTVNPFTRHSSAARGCHVPARCSRLASQALEEKGGTAKNKAINPLPLCYIKPCPAQPAGTPARTLAELGKGL